MFIARTQCPLSRSGRSAMFMNLALRSSGAPKTFWFRCYKHIVPLGRRVTTRCLAIALLASFVATLIPIAGASLKRSDTMACCIGKTAGHCDSGVAAKKLPDPKDPMCGLDNGDMEDDGITVVAEPAHTESHQTSEAAPSGPAVQSASLSQ